MVPRLIRCFLATLLLLSLAASAQMEMPKHKPRGTSSMISNAPGPDFDLGSLVDPTLTPHQQLGKRLFLETRFANFFAKNCGQDVNQPIAAGDPTVATVQLRDGQSTRGPFAGQSINCRSCHFVEEFSGAIGGGTRAYSDFVPRSPVPDRGDGARTTPRNSLSMVDSGIVRPGAMFLHADGEFTSYEALVRATITGRNFGWLPTETGQAIAHIARIIREDNGKGRLGALFGGSYRNVLAAPADMPPLLRLPAQYRLDVASATDEQIFGAVISAISDYLDSLTFSRDSQGAHNGSPYDLFLAKNGLPRAPRPGETDAQYTQRLLQLVTDLRDPKWVVPTDGTLISHNQFYQFGPLELEGLRIFLRSQQPPAAPSTDQQKRSALAPLLIGILPLASLALVIRSTGRTRTLYLLLAAFVAVLLAGVLAHRSASAQAPVAQAGGTGNCAACHAAPHFTDFGFHNTGSSQEEYDSVHGPGAFQRLQIPTLAERERDWNRYLPATPQHPLATSAFRSPARTDSALAADLGMWNIFANPDYPDPQQAMLALLCGSRRDCTREQALAQSVARFKTPSLRDLGHSDPYLHNGSKRSVEEVLRFYIKVSQLARDNKLRNPDVEISRIHLSEADIKPLVAFLRSLNEDYE